MVVFTCNGCGDSLRKNKVQAHITHGRCRNSAVSCIDCGKDFWGNDFDKHTTCISEAEKYSGKNYVPKPNANKGEQKQQEWLMQVESAIQKVQTNPQLREIFERMKGYPNIPRKEKPFKNFLRNSLAVWKEDLCSQVWNLLNANVDKPNKGPNVNQSAVGNSNMNGASAPQGSVNGHMTGYNGDTQGKTLSKREKKEQRQKQSHKAEKKDRHSGKTDSEYGDIQNGDDMKKKKKRKRKHDDENEEVEEKNSAKKRKNDNKEGGDDQAGNEEPTPEKHIKPKFRWQAVMLDVVKAKGEELKIKKLRKKVLAEYMSMGCTEKPEDNLYAKFDKKLKKHPGLKVFNDRVKLAS